MYIGVLKASLYLSEPQSLKDKRRIVKSLIERLNNKFNLSAAETGNLDSWNNCELGVVCISNEAAHSDRMIASAISFIENLGTVELTHVETEIIPF
jgi:uncharacterized protein YlxP (DUF503 family)